MGVEQAQGERIAHADHNQFEQKREQHQVAGEGDKVLGRPSTDRCAACDCIDEVAKHDRQKEPFDDPSKHEMA